MAEIYTGILPPEATWLYINFQEAKHIPKVIEHGKSSGYVFKLKTGYEIFVPPQQIDSLIEFFATLNIELTDKRGY